MGDAFATRPFSFHVPAAGSTWHWAFFSCNGVDNLALEGPTGGIEPMWKDLLSQHDKHPMHLMVGGESWRVADLHLIIMCFNHLFHTPPPRRGMHQRCNNSVFTIIILVHTSRSLSETSGGDQLYNDAVFSGPILGSFDKIETKLEASEKIALPFSPRMKV